MFGTNHSKLKANLKLAIQRLKLLERKKTENARKSTNFTQLINLKTYLDKYDRARIKVEHIIREDYLVEGMEIVEMYCDLLLARFGLVESMKELDLGLYECVSSLIWVAPRLEAEVGELKVIADELSNKYGKEFAQMCRSNRAQKVNEKLMIKMSEQAPDALLVEKYLLEIAKSHNVPFKPDSDLAVRDPYYFYDSVNEKPKNNNNNNSGGNGGNTEILTPQSISNQSTLPLYPSPQQVSYIGFNNTSTSSNQNQHPTKKQPSPATDENIDYPSVPDSFPALPNFNNNNNNKTSNNPSDSFDDLAARFENLKKK